MRSYAEGTLVSPVATRAQIENLLGRFGCTQVVIGYEETRAMLGFVWGGRGVRITLPMPSPQDETICLTPSGRRRSSGVIKQRFQAEVRRRWRALYLVMKAKLTAVQDRISTFEREFLPDLVLPDGRTVIEAGGGPLKTALSAGKISLLPEST